MWKQALAAVVLAAAIPSTAAAQQLVSYDGDSCRRIASTAEMPAGRDLLYARAACIAARAGVAAPANGPLTQEELLSILMLMSLSKAPAATHASS